MRISKLSIAAMFVASLAWSGVAKADDPCGAPAELLGSCEVVEEPECYEVCEPDAMLISCMSDGSAACIAECEDADSIECEASCDGECKASCSDGVIPGEPEDCEVSCGADCMGSCAASCLQAEDKTLCFAACGQQCSAHCDLSCAGGGGECEVSCEQSCEGSCKAEGARDCEISCQAEASASCKAEIGEKCHEVCRGGGVLVCDEQFVDIDDIDACLAALERRGVAVDGPVDALQPKSTIVAPAGASCSVEDQAKLGFAGALFTMLSFGLGATALRRRQS